MRSTVHTLFAPGPLPSKHQRFINERNEIRLDICRFLASSARSSPPSKLARYKITLTT